MIYKFSYTIHLNQLDEVCKKNLQLLNSKLLIMFGEHSGVLH